MQQADLGEAVGTQNVQGVFPSIIVSLDYMSKSYSLSSVCPAYADLRVTPHRCRMSVSWRDFSNAVCVSVSSNRDRIPFTRLEIVMKLLQSSPSSLSAVSDSLVQHLYCSAFQPSANSLLRPIVCLICSLKSWWSRLVTSCENTKSWRECFYSMSELRLCRLSIIGQFVRTVGFCQVLTVSAEAESCLVSGSPLNLSAMLAEPITCNKTFTRLRIIYRIFMDIWFLSRDLI